MFSLSEEMQAIRLAFPDATIRRGIFEKQTGRTYIVFGLNSVRPSAEAFGAGTGDLRRDMSVIVLVDQATSGGEEAVWTTYYAAIKATLEDLGWDFQQANMVDEDEDSLEYQLQLDFTRHI